MFTRNFVSISLVTRAISTGPNPRFQPRVLKSTDVLVGMADGATPMIEGPPKVAMVGKVSKSSLFPPMDPTRAIGSATREVIADRNMTLTLAHGSAICRATTE